MLPCQLELDQSQHFSTPPHLPPPPPAQWNGLQEIVKNGSALPLKRTLIGPECNKQKLIFQDFNFLV